MIETATDSELWQLIAAKRDQLSSEGFIRIISDQPAPGAGIIMVPQAEALWRAVLAKCEELAAGTAHGGSRSAQSYGSDGRSCEATLSRAHPDGTDTVWRIQAYDTRAAHLMRDMPEIAVTVHGPYLDNHDRHWERLLRKAVPGDHVVCGHGWYSFGSGSGGGFGGQQFRWRDLATGEERSSRGMWFAGVIPPAWRERIPDTHEMLEGFPPRFIA
jgi:hypothetical protein